MSNQPSKCGPIDLKKFTTRIYGCLVTSIQLKLLVWEYPKMSLCDPSTSRVMDFIYVFYFYKTSLLGSNSIVNRKIFDCKVSKICGLTEIVMKQKIPIFPLLALLNEGHMDMSIRPSKCGPIHFKI